MRWTVYAVLFTDSLKIYFVGQILFLSYDLGLGRKKVALLAGSADGRLRLYDASTGSFLFSIQPALRDGITAMACDQQLTYLFVADAGGLVQIYDIRMLSQGDGFERRCFVPLRVFIAHNARVVRYVALPTPCKSICALTVCPLQCSIH